MKSATPSNIDAYIKSCPKDVQPILQQIRECIQQTVPEAEEAISYAIPTFKLMGKNMVHFAAFKSHIGFYPTPTGVEAFQKELEKYKQGKGSVQFPLDQKMPLALIKKIVKYNERRIREA